MELPGWFLWSRRLRFGNGQMIFWITTLLRIVWRGSFANGIKNQDNYRQKGTKINRILLVATTGSPTFPVVLHRPNPHRLHAHRRHLFQEVDYRSFIFRKTVGIEFFGDGFGVWFFRLGAVFLFPKRWQSYVYAGYFFLGIYLGNSRAEDVGGVAGFAMAFYCIYWIFLNPII